MLLRIVVVVVVVVLVLIEVLVWCRCVYSTGGLVGVSSSSSRLTHNNIHCT